MTPPERLGRMTKREAPLNRSVERVARILSFFSPDEPELTLAEITSRLQTAKPTTHRYAMALREVGLLRYDARRAVYTLGPRIVELAASAMAGLRVAEVAGPYLRGLASEVNETAVLSVWGGDAPVVVHVEDNTNKIVRIVVRNGTRLPLRSAQGRVFAAFGTDAAAAAGFTVDELAAVRSSGVALNSHVVEGIASAATPVFQDRELVAAIALVGTVASIPAEADAAPIRRLRNTAELISTQLGFLPVRQQA